MRSRPPVTPLIPHVTIFIPNVPVSFFLLPDEDDDVDWEDEDEEDDEEEDEDEEEEPEWLVGSCSKDDYGLFLRLTHA